MSERRTLSAVIYRPPSSRGSRVGVRAPRHQGTGYAVAVPAVAGTGQRHAMDDDGPLRGTPGDLLLGDTWDGRGCRNCERVAKARGVPR